MTMNSHTFPHILVVKSSAGAGKTYNLALRYLQLLVHDLLTGTGHRTRISNIVAITFTNKAAQEMRSRIIDWMKRIILDLPFENSSRRPMEEIIAAVSGQRSAVSAKDADSPKPPDLQILEPLLRETIEKNFEDMLKDFYDFNVSTIDSFVNLTLKASAFKLNLLPDFDISTDSSTYIDLVLQECLQKILEDDAVKEKFDRFLRNYTELEGEYADWVPKHFLRDIISSFWAEEAKENAAFVSRTDLPLIGRLKKQIENDVSGLAAYLKETNGLKPDKRFLKALEELDLSNRSELKGSNYFLRRTLAESLNKNSAEPDAEHERIWKGILKSISIFFEAISESRFSSYMDIYALFKQLLAKEITHHKRVVLIEQLNALLQHILHEQHFIPEIYYALAERYIHFLIDEFQDTNHLQWKNIQILAEEALSRGGTLFLVGDKKQAIYRWRGGRSEIVDEVIRQYKSYNIKELLLAENYRSGEYIVKFNNALFDTGNLSSLISAVAPDAETKIAETYIDSSQNPLNTKAGSGYIRVEKMVDQTDDGSAIETFSKDEKNEITKTRVQQLIRDIRGRSVFEDRDIAVLVRRKEEARFIVKALLEAGIGVESEFTVNIKNNSLIIEMVSFLRFINSPDDDLALAAFLTGSIFQSKSSLPEGEIIRWITDKRLEGPSQYLYRALQRDYPSLWNAHFEYFFTRAGYLPLYEFVVLFAKRWEILTRFSDDAPYFMHLLELVKEKEGLEINNLNQFLQFWNRDGNFLFWKDQEDDKSFLLNSIEGTNAVKVLTIHRAKGLQFPVVILPFLKMSTFGASDSRDKAKYFVREGEDMQLMYIKKAFTKYSPKLHEIYREKEAEYLLDELNNLYVACTRPEKELYIFLTDSRRQKNHLIDYLFNLEGLREHIDGNVIEMGRQTDYVSGTADGGLKKENSTKPETPSFDDMGEDIGWMEKIRTKFEEAPKLFQEQLFAKKKGDVIHYILSLVKVLPEEDSGFLKACIAAGTAKYNFYHHAPEIKEKMVRFFLNQEFRSFFQPGNAVIYTEKEILDSHGNTYKIDRMAVTDDHIDIIDFKTGETRSDEHLRQISHYAALMRQIYPDKPIKKYLLYIDESKVTEI